MLDPEPENSFSFPGNNQVQECSHKRHPPIREVAGVVVVVVVVAGVAAGMPAVQVREGTTMIVAKGADTAHISWSLKCVVYFVP